MLVRETSDTESSHYGWEMVRAWRPHLLPSADSILRTSINLAHPKMMESKIVEEKNASTTYIHIWWIGKPSEMKMLSASDWLHAISACQEQIFFYLFVVEYIFCLHHLYWHPESLRSPPKLEPIHQGSETMTFSECFPPSVSSLYL